MSNNGLHKLYGARFTRIQPALCGSCRFFAIHPEYVVAIYLSELEEDRYIQVTEEEYDRIIWLRPATDWPIGNPS